MIEYVKNSYDKYSDDNRSSSSLTHAKRSKEDEIGANLTQEVYGTWKE